MLDAFTGQLWMLIGASQISVVLRQGWPRRTARVLTTLSGTEGMSGPQALAEPLGRWLQSAGYQGRVVHVLMADELVRYWTVQPPTGLGSPRDLQAAAEMKFQSLYDDGQQDWSIQADLQAHTPFLACALPLHWLDTIGACLTAQGMLMASAQPEFVAVWNHWCKQLEAGAWLGLIREGRLCWGVPSQGRAMACRQVVLPANAKVDPHWLREATEREALRMNLPAPSLIALGGTVPHQWLAQQQGQPRLKVLGLVSDAASLCGVCP